MLAAQVIPSLKALHAVIHAKRSYASAFKRGGTPERKHLGVKPPATTAHMAARRYVRERRVS